jgi:secreted trypsin-like serine protease
MKRKNSPFKPLSVMVLKIQFTGDLIMHSKLLFLSLVVLGLSGCDNSSGDSARVKPPTAQENGKVCVPESELWKPSESTAAIVGGERVNEGDVDAKKVVMVISRKGKGAELCTAAAIAPDVLLTAAHCAVASAKDTKVATYTSISCESGFDARYNTQTASDVVANENYDSNIDVADSQNDVALIFLNQELPYGYPVYRIADPAQMDAHSNLKIYGFGEVGYHQAGSGMLRKAQIPESDFRILKDEGKIEINQTSGTGICSGDSGGPGLVSVNGELQILGVNSYGMNKKGSDICKGYGYMALANKYRDWIKTQMQIRGRYLPN